MPNNLLDALDESESQVREHVIQSLEHLRAEAAQRRERETRIKEEWLKKSFDYLIAESNAKLFDYDRRAEQGKDMRLAIQQEEENLKRLIREKEERLKALEHERTLTVLEPQLEAVILVCAAHPEEAERPEVEADLQRIEAIGMEVAMEYERQNGRTPTDVSKEYLGYDIRSEGSGETRYIEVKAFATTGDLHFTPHEWQMAQRLGDEYWLYVVENANTQPTLYTIQNPAGKFRPVEVTGIVKYVVKVEDLRKTLEEGGR